MLSLTREKNLTFNFFGAICVLLAPSPETEPMYPAVEVHNFKMDT